MNTDELLEAFNDFSKPHKAIKLPDVYNEPRTLISNPVKKRQTVRQESCGFEYVESFRNDPKLSLTKVRITLNI